MVQPTRLNQQKKPDKQGISAHPVDSNESLSLPLEQACSLVLMFIAKLLYTTAAQWK